MRFALLLLLVGCSSDDGGPRLSSVEPAAASPGAQVVIEGERLCGESGDCATAAGEFQVGFSPPTARANVIDYQDTTATIMIPTVATVGTSAIVVIVNERASNALDFEVLPPGTP